MTNGFDLCYLSVNVLQGFIYNTTIRNIGRKRKMLNKGLAVAVILLFIGVAFAPSFNANSTSEKEITENIKDSDRGISNRNCKIRGEITNARSFSLLYMLLGLYNWGIPRSFNPDFPIKLWATISLGVIPATEPERASVGWIWTDGLDGIQEINGSLWGNINKMTIHLTWASVSYWIGVKGFIGTMETDSNTDITHINGYAREVGIR